MGTYNYANTQKKYQNTSVTLSPEATSYYASREGIFSDSMEDKKGWSKNTHNPSCISFDDTNAHLGKTSLKINTTGYTVSYVQSDFLIPINNTAATEYTFSGWVKSDNPTAQLTLFKYEENKTTYTTESVNTTALGNWIFITKTVVVPANSKYLNLRVDNIGTGNVWFDDVMIRKTSNTPLVNLQTPTPNSYTDHQLTIDYNTFKSPVNISEAGVDKLSFVYNDNNDRSVMFYGSLDDNKTLRPNRKYYSADGTMEIKQNIQTGEIEFVTYLGGDGYSAPVVYKKTFDTAGNAQEQMLYLHRDYQGSIIAITNDTGAIVEKRQFDAWGAIVKVQDGAGNVLTGLTILDRGYTGHEHLQSVGLINMNGRLYDPKLHRFLQPDNYVQDPSNTQNYNRYSYVLNNPLKYTDPSGEKWKITWSDIVSAVAIVGGAVLCFIPGLAVIGVPLIGAGVAHFATALNEFKQTGDWGSASNNAGFIVSFTAKTDWGYDSKTDVNGVSQSGQGTDSGSNGNSGDQYQNIGPYQRAFYERRDESNRFFYGVSIRLLPNFIGAGGYFAGAINIPQYMWDGYKSNGLDSKEGRFLMHEYGHYLQEKHNALWYNTYVAPSSFVNAIFNNQSEHAKHWAEIQASTYAWYYFGFPKDFKKENDVNSNYLSLQIRKSIFRRYLKN